MSDLPTAEECAHQAWRMDVINKGGRDPDLESHQGLGPSPEVVTLRQLLRVAWEALEIVAIDDPGYARAIRALIAKELGIKPS
jgi:hypothetical protein